MNINALKSILIAATTGGALALFTAPAATAGGLAGPYGPANPYATPYPPPRFVPWRQHAFARQPWGPGHPARVRDARAPHPNPGLRRRAAPPPLMAKGVPHRGPHARMAPTRWRASATPATLAARLTHRPVRYDPYAAWPGPAARQMASAPPGRHPAAHYRWRPVQPPGHAFEHRFAERAPRALPGTRHYRFRPWGGPRGRTPAQPVLAGFQPPHSGRAGIPGPSGQRAGLPYRFRPLGPGAVRPSVAALTRPASSAMPLHGAPGPLGFRPLARAPRQQRPVAGSPWNRGWSAGVAQADPRLYYRFRPDPRLQGGQWSRLHAAAQPDAPRGQGSFADGDRLAMSVTNLALPDSRPRRGVTGGTRIY